MGPSVGNWVGSLVGNKVGSFVGNKVGSFVGNSVGLRVGDFEAGGILGDLEGNDVDGLCDGG